MNISSPIVAVPPSSAASSTPTPAGVWRRWFIWNWKGAVLSAFSRGALFLVINIGAGPAAALTAMGTQMVFRLSIGGLVSGVIERVCLIRPSWLGTSLAFTIVPLLVHSTEFVAHAGTGSPNLILGEIVSILVTLMSTAFQLFAMRRGALISGEGHKSFVEDMAALPRLLAAFTGSILRAAVLPIVRTRVSAR